MFTNNESLIKRLTQHDLTLDQAVELLRGNDEVFTEEMAIKAFTSLLILNMPDCNYVYQYVYDSDFKTLTFKITGQPIGHSIMYV